MSIRQSIPRFSLRLSSPVKPSSRGFFSTSQSPSPKDPQSRLRRLNDRLPRFLRSYTTPLIGAPGTHITSFLILHELTAIVPLFGLVAAFHYGNWLPDLTSSTAFEEGTRRFGRWLRKKGWIEEDVDMATVTADGPTTGHSNGDGEKKGVRLVLEFATAYAVTKALLPIRIAASVWATPWFARAVLSPVGRGIRRVFKRN